MVKEYNAALEQLEIILSRPGPYSAALLKLDPKRKSLGDNPKFIRLIEKYSKEGVNSHDSKHCVIRHFACHAS